MYCLAEAITNFFILAFEAVCFLTLHNSHKPSFMAKTVKKHLTFPGIEFESFAWKISISSSLYSFKKCSSVDFNVIVSLIVSIKVSICNKHIPQRLRTTAYSET